ncbi:MAG: hypothetical protein GXY38_09440 [Planctomycetes bacterium]|jgi:hypothetical protein|nr:hypothetical protein [Planctomycetota bacterium]
MRSMEIRCVNPHCREILLVPEHLVGSVVKCAKCSQQFVVPFSAQKVWRLRIQPPPRRNAG